MGSAALRCIKMPSGAGKMEIPVWMTATIPGGAGGVSTAAVITSRTVSQAHRAKSFKSSRWWRKYAKNIIDGLGGTITVSS